MCVQLLGVRTKILSVRLLGGSLSSGSSPGRAPCRRVQGLGGDQRAHARGAAAHPPCLLCGRRGGAWVVRWGLLPMAPLALHLQASFGGFSRALCMPACPPWPCFGFPAHQCPTATAAFSWICHALAAAEGLGPTVRRTLPGGRQPMHLYQARGPAQRHVLALKWRGEKQR